MPNNKDLITAQALAAALNLSVETIWRYTRENKIPYIELGGRQYRYNLNDVIGALSGSAAREKEPGYKGYPDKKYTYEDYLQIPDEPGYRFEVLEGELVREPSPNVPHQRASRELLMILNNYFREADPESEVFAAPLDVTFDELNVVQPDILYVSGEKKEILKHTRIDGPPTLVVEILSPSTYRKDRLRKMQIYQRAKIQHYWLVNPDDKTLECFSLRNGLYAFVASGMEDEVVEHPEFPGLTVDLKTLWA
jgi:Uma2 family endonuclease